MIRCLVHATLACIGCVLPRSGPGDWPSGRSPAREDFAGTRTLSGSTSQPAHRTGNPPTKAASARISAPTPPPKDLFLSRAVDLERSSARVAGSFTTERERDFSGGKTGRLERSWLGRPALCSHFAARLLRREARSKEGPGSKAANRRRNPRSETLTPRIRNRRAELASLAIALQR